MVLCEVVQKTEIYHSLRRVRAPKDIEDKMGGPPDISQASMHLSPSQSPPPLPTPGIRRIGHPEYRTFTPNITDQVFYAPVSTNSMPSQTSPHSTNSNASCQDPRRRGESFGSHSSPGMIDVDWVSSTFNRLVTYPKIIASHPL